MLARGVIAAGRGPISLGGRRRVGGWLVALAAMPALTSCQSGAPLPAGGATVDVTMREYSFELPAQLSAGRAVFRVHNRGQATHEFIVAPLPPGYPSVQAQLHSPVRRPLPAVALMPPHAAGRDGVIAVDLVSGRYGVFSFVAGSDGTPDALRGMASEFRVS